MPVEIRSVEAICCKPSEVIGSTEKPSSSIRNGYSFVPCVEPRYLTTRSRREEIWSLDAMVEHDDAVGDVLFQSLARQRRFAAFAGDDGRHAFVLQPAKQAAQFGAQDERIGQAGEERLDGIQHDALGADRVDGMPEADEQSFQIVFAGLFDFTALDVHIIQHDLLARDQVFQVETERGDVLGQVLGGLFEGHKDARLVELRRAAHQELHGEQRLAAARAAADQRRPAFGQSAAGDFVQPLDAGRRFG